MGGAAFGRCVEEKKVVQVKKARSSNLPGEQPVSQTESRPTSAHSSEERANEMEAGALASAEGSVKQPVDDGKERERV